jgi:RHS repeat-associated protein
LQRTAYYTYDQIGNLTGITSNINQSFDWEGRRLIEHSIGGTTYTYTYNDQGIRTSRSDGTDTTTYFLDGSLVLLEKTGNDVIYYTYDADGSILSMNYLGDEYFYIKNLQGDIIEVVDASGTTVAKYRYDAWGNIVYQWDSGLGIANANPYRYRSYRFDSGTGLYYLNARYYDPSIGRFISADSINYLDPSSGQGLNLYAYCGNNPVMYTDPSGEFAISISLILLYMAISAGIGAAFSMGATIYDDYKDDGQIFNGSIELWDYMGNVIGGTVAGAGIGLATVLGVGVGAAVLGGTSLTVLGVGMSYGVAFSIGVGASALTGSMGYLLKTSIGSSVFSSKDLVAETTLGAIYGGIGFIVGMAGGATGFRPGRQTVARLLGRTIIEGIFTWPLKGIIPLVY